MPETSCAAVLMSCETSAPSASRLFRRGDKEEALAPVHWSSFAAAAEAVATNNCQEAG